MHFVELEPCLMLGVELPPKCSNYTEEISYVNEYQTYLAESWMAPSASGLLVLFHNLVSSSVTNTKYLMGNSKHYYCVSDVMQAIPKMFVSDVPVPAPPANVKPTGLPGLSAQDPLVSCP
mmetsp:Transcript_22090/g.56360  ORF Transcript_22090/g.56360 Transcript_22090/m.56360 type:complete len:120 (-) Transcript_22090:330-689(-)